MPEVPTLDAGAIDELYEAVAGPVYGVSLAVTGCPEKAQAACIRVFSHLCRHHSEDLPDRGSLVRGATQLAHRFALLLADDEAAADRRASELLHLERLGLSDEQRHDLALAYFGGLTYRQIARDRGAEPGQVAEVLSAGLHSLCRPSNA